MRAAMGLPDGSPVSILDAGGNYQLLPDINPNGFDVRGLADGASRYFNNMRSVISVVQGGVQAVIGGGSFSDGFLTSLGSQVGSQVANRLTSYLGTNGGPLQNNPTVARYVGRVFGAAVSSQWVNSRGGDGDRAFINSLIDATLEAVTSPIRWDNWVPSIGEDALAIDLAHTSAGNPDLSQSEPLSSSLARIAGGIAIEDGVELPSGQVLQVRPESINSATRRGAVLVNEFGRTVVGIAQSVEAGQVVTVYTNGVQQVIGQAITDISGDTTYRLFDVERNELRPVNAGLFSLEMTQEVKLASTWGMPDSSSPADITFVIVGSRLSRPLNSTHVAADVAYMRTVLDEDLLYSPAISPEEISYYGDGAARPKPEAIKLLVAAKKLAEAAGGALATLFSSFMDVLEVGDIQQLKVWQGKLIAFVDEALKNGGLSTSDKLVLVAIKLALEVFFPTNVIDLTPFKAVGALALLVRRGERLDDILTAARAEGRAAETVRIEIWASKEADFIKSDGTWVRLASPSASGRLIQDFERAGISIPAGMVEPKAHHIVGFSTDAQPAQRILSGYGITPNQSINGVWLSNADHVKTYGSNLGPYSEWVNGRLILADSIGGRDAVVAELNLIASILSSGAKPWIKP